jgi:hypothetical protein
MHTPVSCSTGPDVTVVVDVFGLVHATTASVAITAITDARRVHLGRSLSLELTRESDACIRPFGRFAGHG